MAGFSLSRQQERIWRWIRSGTAHAARVVVEVEGELRLDDLRAAVEGAVRRHAVLRTTFAGPAQTIAETAGFVLEVLDETAGAGEAGRYHAVTGTPNVPLRVAVVPRGPRRHLLSITLPMLCADGPSLRTLVGEIAAGYGGGPRPGEAVPYADLAAWQDAEGAGSEDTETVAVAPERWLAGQALQLEAGAAVVAGYRALGSVLEPGLVAALDEFCHRRRVPAADVLMACWQILIWRHAGTPEVTVGRTWDGRELDELAEVIGPGSSMHPVTLRLAAGDRFTDVLQSLGRRLDDLAEEPARGGSVTPAFGFDFAEIPPAVAADGTVFRIAEQVAWTAPVAVMLHAERDGDRLRLLLEHDPGRIDAGAAGVLLDQLTALLAAAISVPDTAVGALNAVGPAEAERQAIAFNRTAADFRAAGLAHQTFETHVAADPGRPALSFEATRLTYGELNARANRLARYLRGLGAGPETIVGVCLDRGAEMVIAVLAAQKAGAAYVPLDPAYPRERLRTVLDDTAMPLILADERTAAVLPDGPGRIVRIDQNHAVIAALPTDDLGLEVHPEQLAYVLHTSGSTGRPKGVQISYGALANFLGAMRDTPGLTARDSLLAVTTLSFDIAGLELFLPLTVGARVTVAGRRDVADPAALARLLTESGATMMQATPVTWRMLLAAGWSGPGLTALVGGEALPPKLAGELRPRVRRLWNMYGPTETTIWSACAEIEPGPGPVSVGRPIANTCVHLVDEALSPVPIGMVGELCIGGAGVARGYAGQAGLTGDRFVPDICGCRPGTRMYRTGDLARYDTEGRLYVLGRADSQVKIRGFRIELGEVETALARHPAVRAAVALARPEPSGDHRLDAYVVLEPAGAATVGELRDFLRGVLPPQMVPTRVGVLAAFPLTDNGKVDRGALPAIGAEPAAPDLVGPAAGSDIERTIAKIWTTVLGVENLGRTANFFDLGGHSVLLVQASGLLQEELGRDVTPLTMLEHPTIAALAQHLSGPPDQAAGADEDVVADGRNRLRLRRARTVSQ